MTLGGRRDVSNTDRLRGIPPPRRPAGRRGRAAGLEPARRAAGRGPGRAGSPGEETGDRGDPDLALRGSGDDRHVGPQARRPRGDPRRVPPDRHDGAGGLHLRAHAGAGEGHGPLHAGPFAGPLDQRPRSGHDLHGHGEPAGAVAGVPRGGGPGGAAAAAAEGRPAVRHVRRARETVPRASDPATSARRTARSRSRATRSRGRSSPAGCRSPRDSRRATCSPARP